MKQFEDKLVCGIDPGLSGAAVLIDNEAEIKAWYRFKKDNDRGIIDLYDLADWLNDVLRRDMPVSFFIEHVQPMRPKGSHYAPAALFTYGRGFGHLEGVMAGCGIAYNLVRVQSWVSEIHVPEIRSSKELTGKQKSAIMFDKLFPVHPLPRGPRSGKVHDGLIDATLIAEYGRRSIEGVLNGKEKTH